jgi:mono/diheme cytochrome c family protein
MTRRLLAFLILAGCSDPAAAPAPPGAARPPVAFLGKHCLECHDSANAKGGLDLSSLPLDAADPKNFALWVKVHDRVRDAEMPPAKRPRPGGAEIDRFLAGISAPLVAADRAREAAEGRSTWRRLNRFEYENTLRDLLQAPWLQIKEMLPEDGEAHRFNKVGDALDVSHVQMAQYLAAADYALREVVADQLARPKTETFRTYARDNRSFAGKMKFNEFNRSPERATFPVLGFSGQPNIRTGNDPVTAGPADPETREKEAIGVVAGAYEPLEPKFNQFKAPRSGRYKVRLAAYSVWTGPGKEPRWWVPDLDAVLRGRRPEPITLYSETPPRLLRRLGAFDVQPDPTVAELDVHLLKGETIRPDPSRLFRSRPPNWRNPLAQKDGSPGVAYKWLEVEGPILEAWPPAGHALLFGDLPLRETAGTVEVVSSDPKGDAKRLLAAFLAKACRRPVPDEDAARFLAVIHKALDGGVPFGDAMIAGYSAVLCSPGFICLEERPGPLDRFALASRVSYFLWNSPPDHELRSANLRNAGVLRAQVERLLDDPRSRRFVDAFLDYWLDLRRVNATSPDAALYPDYYLDDLLVESADLEPRLFFAELLRKDLPARNVVASDFVMVNERLAAHYALPPVDGVALRRVPLPEGSVRGGLMTTAGVLKVTANGTTTSPVLRGAWIMERILGKPAPPPPPSVPSVEPDIRGAVTIREQLDRHRTQKTCAACHAKIDPAGFALESFDVFGGFRDGYRALGEGTRVSGFGKNGQPFEFHRGRPVDPSGELPGGGAFRDVVELKRLLLEDERQIARNLARQLIVFATGSTVRFGDRAQVEAILDRAAPGGYGLRTIVREIALSGLFQRK